MIGRISTPNLVGAEADDGHPLAALEDLLALLPEQVLLPGRRGFLQFLQRLFAALALRVLFLHELRA
jgi:hypothetical protein